MTNDRSFPTITLLIALGLGATGAAGQGPSLLENGNFHTDTTGWTTDTGYAGSMTWASADASGSPHSGSAKLTAPNGEVLVLGDDCLRVEAGEQLVLSGSVWVDEAGPDARIRFGFADFEAPDCDTMAGGFGLAFALFAEAEHQTGRWQELAAGLYELGEVRFIRPALWIQSGGSDVTAYFDRLDLRSGRCTPGPTTLCLNEGRFEVKAFWRTADGSSDEGRAVPFAADSGSFWFFSPTNLELDVKVLDGCGSNGHYWVFAAGLTDVEVTLQVRDTETEIYWARDNPLGRTFVTITDTEAFATCMQ